jgi:glucose-1-phosphate cytidylyltransferase
MKVIILAGGLGTRISEETADKPKPMVLLNDKPILWHIMSIFAKQGHTDFVIAAGYKGEVISDWINSLETTWKISAFDTGLNTQTGGRITEVMKTLTEEKVIATYGDGLANISIKKLLEFHASHGKLATVTAVRPPARFGYMKIENNKVTHFGEKQQSDEGWIPTIEDINNDDSSIYLTSTQKIPLQSQAVDAGDHQMSVMPQSIDEV